MTCLACNSAISKEGLYQYEVQNSDVDCSLFIIGEADQLLEMSFDAFDVSCEGDGFLMVCYTLTDISDHITMWAGRWLLLAHEHYIIRKRKST